MKVIMKRLIKEGKVEEAVNVYKDLVELTRLEKGCRSYNVFQQIENPNILAVIEEWENKAALDQHLSTDHYKKFGPKLNDLTEKKYGLECYNNIL